MYFDIVKFIDYLRIDQWATILTVVGIPIIFIKIIFYKAKHKIFFDPKETYHQVKLVDHPLQPQSFWLQLMVKNKGYEVSKNSEAYLSEIWVKNNNKYEKLSDFRSPVKLKWSHEEDIFPIDILPKEKRRLDVCYICNGENTLRIMAKGFPSGSIKNELPANNYLFIIKVVGDNSLSPKEFIFNIIWDGSWNNLVGCKYVKSFNIYKSPVKSFSLV